MVVCLRPNTIPSKDRKSKIEASLTTLPYSRGLRRKGRKGRKGSTLVEVWWLRSDVRRLRFDAYQGGWTRFGSLSDSDLLPSTAPKLQSSLLVFSWSKPANKLVPLEFSTITSRLALSKEEKKKTTQSASNRRSRRRAAHASEHAKRDKKRTRELHAGGQTAKKERRGKRNAAKGKANTHRGARTHDHTIKSRALYRLS